MKGSEREGKVVGWLVGRLGRKKGGEGEVWGVLFVFGKVIKLRNA